MLFSTMIMILIITNIMLLGLGYLQPMFGAPTDTVLEGTSL